MQQFLLVAGDAEPGAGPGPKRYVITEIGAAMEFETWLSQPAEPEPHLQTVLFAEVELALMLDRSAERYLRETVRAEVSDRRAQRGGPGRFR